MVELVTPRLKLRQLQTDDLSAFVALAGEWDVARMTSDIPYPLSPEVARQWLNALSGDVRFAIELDGMLVGGVGYFSPGGKEGELGFWIGRPYWGEGLASEATAAVIAHAFERERLAALTSSHFDDNPASARVLAKLGFKPSGPLAIWCPARNVSVAATVCRLARADWSRSTATGETAASRRAGWHRLAALIRG